MKATTEFNLAQIIDSIAAQAPIAAVKPVVNPEGAARFSALLNDAIQADSARESGTSMAASAKSGMILPLSTGFAFEQASRLGIVDRQFSPLQSDGAPQAAEPGTGAQEPELVLQTISFLNGRKVLTTLLPDETPETNEAPETDEASADDAESGVPDDAGPLGWWNSMQELQVVSVGQTTSGGTLEGMMAVAHGTRRGLVGGEATVDRSASLPAGGQVAAPHRFEPTMAQRVDAAGATVLPVTQASDRLDPGQAPRTALPASNSSTLAPIRPSAASLSGSSEGGSSKGLQLGGNTDQFLSARQWRQARTATRAPGPEAVLTGNNKETASTSALQQANSTQQISKFDAVHGAVAKAAVDLDTQSRELGIEAPTDPRNTPVMSTGALKGAAVQRLDNTSYQITLGLPLQAETGGQNLATTPQDLPAVRLPLTPEDNTELGNQLFQVVAEQIELPEGGAQSRLRIEVNPPELGQLEIEMSRDGDRLDISILTSSEAAAESLRETSHVIRDLLGRYDNTRVSIGIDVGARSSNGGQEPSGAGRERGQTADEQAPAKVVKVQVSSGNVDTYV